MGLTVKRVAKLRRRGEAGVYSDGGSDGIRGLRLVVQNKRASHWELRYQINKKARQMGLGSASDFSLAQARERAKAARQKLADKVDPLEARRTERATKLAAAATKMTFKEAAEAYFAAHQNEWRSAKHGAQWMTTLRDYAFPFLGALDVSQIGVPTILKVLEQKVPAARGFPAGQLWQVRTVTADRTRSRIEQVLNFAHGRGHRLAGENPASWSHLQHILAEPKKVAKVVHHAAVPYAQVPALIAELHRREGVGVKAMEFLILTSARLGEVIGATWQEIDLANANKTWVIPAERMKGGRDHRVPLAPRAVELLRSLPTEANNPHLFIGPRSERISADALTAVLRRLGRSETVHGSRSSFSDWAHEKTAYDNHTIEISLAHKVGNEVERSYRRGDLFDKRRKLMEAWASYVTTSTPVSATVTPIRSEARS
jgi:integrase